jgi:glutamine amidotransferase
MTIAVIDYGLGNLTSVVGAVEKLGFDAIATADHERIGMAEKLILPGVGAFGDGMRNLRNQGLVELLGDLVLVRKRPILGICLGFQLLAEESEEFGRHKGLGWVAGHVRRLGARHPELRVPHVGWNDLQQESECFLYRDIAKDSLFYYVHSFALQMDDRKAAVGSCTYGERFVSVLHRENICGTQFHPEKSQLAGLTLLGNFLNSY